MTETRLEFLKNQAGEDEGLGHAGIETFRDTPFTSCSREAGQNTLDAAAIETDAPVELVLREHMISAVDIPGIEKLRETIAACLKSAHHSGTEKDADFFRNARQVVSQDEIPVLEIADFNTTGLEGPPNDSGSKFHALVKSAGKSNKSTETSGGSFGIGKNATFAVSDLRTVFYSTVYGTDGNEKSAVQGKVQLVSHKDAEGIERTSKGYWGYADDFSAVEDPEKVPEWLRRGQKGTSVFSIGFRGREDWVDRMTVPLLSNFFAAIEDRKIVFKVGNDERIVSAETLPDLLEDPKIVAAAEEASHGDDIQLARQLFQCRSSEDATSKCFRIDGLGEFSAKILVKEGMPKRVAIIRNGMLIAGSLEFFGDKFARFPGARDFVLLVEPADNEAKKILKSLENPQHNAFSAGRLDDPKKQKDITRAMKRLINEIRQLIRDNAEITGGDAVKLDELGEFFADAGSEDSRVPSSEDDPETIRFTPARRRKSKPPSPAAHYNEGEKGGAGSGDGTGGAGTDGRGDGTGAGDDGAGNKGEQSIVRLTAIRNVESSPGVRKVFFTPDESGKIELTFRAMGVFDATDLRVTSASGIVPCAANRGHVAVEASKGDRVEIEVTFEEDYAGPLEIFAVRGTA